ncbi:hypothetical protein D9758_011267 [Tetrapyrgos nigripes]|uniref:Uncharacterized protein n=1 Tax=Tetrapyrgos nigripes TaxID=182062 RepID=A0A8H5CT43_9AGAR|nr:hypothetical protein D9758_011267 [Tetrapyrgos nigripes]
MSDQVLASLKSFPNDVSDDDAMKNPDTGDLQSHMDARQARVTPSDKMRTAVYFVKEFDRVGNLDNLDSATRMMRDALHGFKAEQNTRYTFHAFRRLVHCLLKRFELSGERKDLDEAIAALWASVGIAPDNGLAAETFYALGESLGHRFDGVGEQDDLMQSLKAFIKGLSLLYEDDEHIPLFVERIAKSLKTCLDCPQLTLIIRATKSKLVDGSESLSKRKRAQILDRLGNDLLEQLLEVGGVQNLDECVNLLQATTSLNPANANAMSLYGLSRLIRFERLGNSDDLATAVATQKAAVELVNETDELLPGILNNLGNALQTRFEHAGKVVDIDEAVNVHVRSLYHSKVKEEERFTFQASLGTAYHRRFEHLWDRMDLDSSVDAKQMAAASVPKDHPYRAQLYASYGGVLLQRYNLFCRPEDLEKSLEIQQEAVELTPSTHPAGPLRLLNLAKTLRGHVLLTKDIRSIEKAINITGEAIPLLAKNNSSYHLALSCPTPALLCHTSSTVMYHISRHRIWCHCLQDAVRALAKGDLDRKCEAVAVAIQAGKLNLALEWAEQGRCIVWSQVLQFRQPVNPALGNLASEMESVTSKLQKMVLHPSSVGDGSVPIEGMSREEYAHRLAIPTLQLVHDGNQQEQRRVAEKYEDLLIRAQELSGSDDFLRPKRFSDLYAITSQGPVVFINVCKERCDAICIVPGQKEAVLIPLESFSEEKAMETLSSLIDDLEEKNFRAKSRGYSKLTARTEKIRNILGTLWTDVVQPILLRLEEYLVAENSNLPHVT